MQTVPVPLLKQITEQLSNLKETHLDVDISCATLAKLPPSLQLEYFKYDLEDDYPEDSLPMFIDGVEYTAFVYFHGDNHNMLAILFTVQEEDSRIAHFECKLIDDNYDTEKGLKEWVQKLGRGTAYSTLYVSADWAKTNGSAT